MRFSDIIVNAAKREHPDNPELQDLIARGDFMHAEPLLRELGNDSLADMVHGEAEAALEAN